MDDVPEHLHKRHPGSMWVVWRPTPRGQQWLVRLDFGKSDDGVTADCVGLEIRSFQETADAGWPAFLPLWDDSPTPLQRRTLRDIPLGQILDDLGSEMLDFWSLIAESFREPIGDPEDDAAAMRDADQIEDFVAKYRVRKPNRSVRGVPDLEAIAQVYLRAKMKRESATKAVAKWGTVSESTASKWIMRVRRDTDLLPPPTNKPRKAQPRRSRGAN